MPERLGAQGRAGPKSMTRSVSATWGSALHRLVDQLDDVADPKVLVTGRLGGIGEPGHLVRATDDQYVGSIKHKVLNGAPKGQRAVYRVAASGKLDDMRTIRYFYLIVGSRGEQLIATFSVVPQQVDRFGHRTIWRWCASIAFPE